MPTNTKTWASFKTHFKTAQAELKEIRGPTMQQAGYHHANMLAQQLRTDLQVQGTDMLALVQGFADANANQPPPEVNPPQAPAANAVIQDAIQMEMLQLLRDIATQNNNNGGRGGRLTVAIVVVALVEAMEALIVVHRTMPVSTVELLHFTVTPTVHAIMYLQIVPARLMGIKILQQWIIAWVGQTLFVENDRGRQNKG